MQPVVGEINENNTNILTNAWLLPLLNGNKAWNAVSGLRKIVEVKNGSGKSDIGFVGKISKIDIVFDDGATQKLVLKTPELNAIPEAIEKTMIMTTQRKKLSPEFADPETHGALVSTFNREIDFYRSPFKTVELKTPQVYYTQKWIIERKQLGIIIMDDLSIDSTTKATFDTLNTSQVAETLSQVVHLQTSAIPQSDQWKKQFKLLRSFVDSFTAMKDLFLLMGRRTEKLGQLIPKFAHLFDDTAFWNYVYDQAYLEIGSQGVMCHGDLWTYNMLWARDKNGECSNHLNAIIDWQNVHEGSCAEDLARLIVFNCDCDVRKECEEKLIPMFHKMMVEKCKTMSIPPLYTIEQLQKLYSIHKVANAIHFAFLVPVLDKMLNEGDDEEHLKNRNTINTRTEDALEEALELFPYLFPQFVR